MRKITILLLFAVSGYAAHAQFSLLPQAGFENPATKISYNGLNYFQPLSSFQPQASIRVEYKFRKGYGVFAGVSSSRSNVSYTFPDPETAMKVYQASAGNVKLQLQAGIKYSTRPLLLNKQTPAARSGHMGKSCGSQGNCCQKKPGCGQKAKTAYKSMFVSIQPLAGLAFMPSNKASLDTKLTGSQQTYTYTAGNVKTALLAGVGFEVGNRHTKFFTLSFNYYKGLSNDQTSLQSFSGTKSITTLFSSKVSGWSGSIGIPISLRTNPFRHEKRSRECQEQNRIRCSYRK